MDSHFIGKEVQVATTGVRNIPVSFVLDNRKYSIVEITESWPDYGFGRKISGKTKWWQRHHRFYYRVKTDTGEVYEIYSDRQMSIKKNGSRKWYASRKY
ncbi:MAG: hypothetical protein JW712_10180 [Dehalococcoidales bacterium]|nr:hypothetical protein [Dehalococcoidales bacterium]